MTETDTVSAVGSSEWLQLGPFDNRIEIRSTDFTGTNSELTYSSDKTSAEEIPMESLEGTGGVFDCEGPGYVRLTVSGTVAAPVTINVIHKARQSAL